MIIIYLSFHPSYYLNNTSGPLCSVLQKPFPNGQGADLFSIDLNISLMVIVQ